MAGYAETLDHNAAVRRQPKNQLTSVELKKADNGGVVVNHRMSRYDGKDPVHAFGADEGHLLAAHIEKHLGIKMSAGKANEEPAKEADED